MQERKRDLYEPYLDEIKQMLEDGCVITHIHKEIAKKSGIDANVKTMKRFMREKGLIQESECEKTEINKLIKDKFKGISDYMDFYERWVRTSCRLNRKPENPNRILMEVFYDIIWTMAKTADRTIPDPLEWLDGFEVFPLNEIMGEVKDLLTDTMPTSKKK